MNIFSTEYTINEIKKVKFHEYQNKEIKVFYKTLKPFSSLDGYMGTRVENTREIQIPIFTIKDKVWMSCTPMEMASHYIPIRKAKGKVGVAGLGMGYYILRIMNKKSVKSIDIYELNSDVIDTFKNEFSNRKGFDNITFIQGNLFDTLIDTEYDFFYNDIYPQLGMQEAIEDMKKITSNYKKIKSYHYWGYEFDFFDAIRNGSIFAVTKLYQDKLFIKVFNDWCEYTEKSYMQFEDDFVQNLYNFKKQDKSKLFDDLIF